MSIRIPSPILLIKFISNLKDILLAIYDFNNSQGRSCVSPLLKKAPKAWCGPRTRLMIQAATTVAFACLLRFDEVLRIQMSDLEFLLDERGNRTIIKVTLRTRKTSQFGGG
jgi:integrase